MKIRFIFCSLFIFVLFITCKKEAKETLQMEENGSFLRNPFVKDTIPTEGIFQIVFAKTYGNGSKVIQSSLKDTASNSAITIGVPSISNSERWNITQIGPFTYSIINIYSKKALQSLGVNHSQLIQAKYTGSEAQLWKIIYVGNGCFALRNKADSMYLAVTGNPFGNNLPVTVSENTPPLTKIWYLKKIVSKDTVVTNFFRRETGMIASDGGYSIPLSDGTILWFFGDSYINSYDPKTGTVPCLFNVRNCALLQQKGNWDWRQAQTLLTDNKDYIRSSSESGHFNWPINGFQMKDTIFVLCLNLKNADNGWWDTAGPPVYAKIRMSDKKVVGYKEVQSFHNIIFGTSFIDGNDGYMYTYGHEGANDIVHAWVYFARFPKNDIYARWDFYKGTGDYTDNSNWTKNVDDAGHIDRVAGFGAHVAKVGNKYLMSSSEFSLGCDGGKEIYISWSHSPAGPFTRAKKVFTIDDYVNGHLPFFYGAIPHPEYINEKNEILLVYSINSYGDCFETCVNWRFNPDYYRVRGIRIPLSLFVPDL